MFIYNKKTGLFEWVFIDLSEITEYESRTAPNSEAGYIDAIIRRLHG